MCCHKKHVDGHKRKIGQRFLQTQSEERTLDLQIENFGFTRWSAKKQQVFSYNRL